MKIALINQKTGYIERIDRIEYTNKINEILRTSKAEIVVGPELAISNRQNLLSFEDFENFNKNFSSFITFIGKNQLLIPGTGLVVDSNKKELRNVAPIITKGKLHYIDKKTSVFEDSIAKTHGLEYKRGNSSEGVFYHNGRKIALEICRDHGHMKLKGSGVGDVDIEFILACNLPGVNPEKTVIKEGGIVALVDGYEPGVNVYRRTLDNFKEIKPIKQNREYSLFNI